MIKLSIWDRLYCHTIDWAIRRMDPDCLEMYNDTVQDWTDALLAFQKVKEELFKTYGVTYKSGDKFKRGCIKGLELTADQLFELFHKHLEQYTNHTVRDFIFHWWNDLRYYVDGAQPPLDQAYLLFKPATKEEVEQARKDFGHIVEEFHGETQEFDLTFLDNAQVLEYRGQRFIVDNEWGDAWTKNKKGEVRHFQLDWDWWYPIDQYLDLYNI